MKRLIIIEPSLVDQRGHHFLLTSVISEIAVDAGIPVIWLVNNEFGLTGISSAVDVRPSFSFTMYDKYKSGKVATNQALSEIEESLNEIEIGSGDHILCHTTFYDIYAAFFQYVSSIEARPSYVVHLCTPYDEATMPGRPDNEAVEALMLKFAQLPAVEDWFYLWTETFQLAEHYRTRIGAPVYALPLPINVARWLSDSTVNTSNDKPVNILYLGAAREEKGFTQLPELIECCKRDPEVWKNVRFTIQATPQIVGYNENILRSITALEAYPTDNIKLLKEPLGEKEYHALLDSSDIVLLLYDKKNYQVRGSGIAVEALALGKCLIATNNTFCAKLIDRCGGKAVNSIEEAYQFIQDYVSNPQFFRDSARLQAHYYNLQNSGIKYIEKLRHRKTVSERTWQRPSATIGYVTPLLIQ